jgi:hypothetical protein
MYTVQENTCEIRTPVATNQKCLKNGKMGLLCLFAKFYGVFCLFVFVFFPHKCVCVFFLILSDSIFTVHYPRVSSKRFTFQSMGVTKL